MAAAEMFEDPSRAAHPAPDMAPDSVAEPGDATPPAKKRVTLLARVPIAARIVAIVAIGLISLIGAGAVQFFANAISDRVGAEAADLRRIGTVVGVTKSNLFEMKLVTAELSPANAADSAAEFDNALKGAIAGLNDIRTLPAAKPAAPSIADARDALAATRPLFSALIASGVKIGDGESSGLAADLRAAGGVLESEMKLWPGVADIMAKLAEARRFEQGLLTGYTDAGAGRLNKAINELDFFIPAGPFGAADTEKIMGQLGDYRKALNALRDEADARVKTRTALSMQFAAAEEALAPLDLFAAEGLNRADEAMAKTRRNTTIIFIAGGAVSIALFLLCSALVANSIISPIRRIQTAMGQLAAGDNTTQIPGLLRRDEIGRMAKSIAIFKDNALEIERIRSSEQEALERAARERRETLQTLADDFERTVRRVASALKTTATKITESASRMAADAEASEEEGEAVAGLIGQSAEAVGMIVDSADDLGRSVHAVDNRMTETSNAINRTLTAANETTDLVNSLSQAAERIGEIVDVINAIAAQTNLLALNATIEAARAGEAGRGFAVVANEVKTLATQTASATEEITSQVSAIRSEVERTVSAINLVRDEVGVIDGLAEQVTGAVRKQEEATTAIASNVSSAASGAESMTARIGVMTAAVQQTARSAGDLVGAAEELAENSHRLEVELEGFLVTVRQG